MNFLKVLICFIIIGFLGWNFFYFIFTSTWFDIKEINIDGNDYLNRETVVTQGGIKFHTNLFHFNTMKAGSSLLQHPWIADISIKKILPDKLIINITERQPGIILNYNELFYLVSEEGVILSVSEQFYDDFDLYIVTGLDISNKKPGDIIDSQEYENIQRIIYALENIFPDQFYKIEVISNEEHILFYKNKQIRVRIKDGDQLVDEWYLLERALQKVIQEETPIQEINMQYKERLSIILKE
ncbi:MAG: cell division protein FtsQ/DivIB [bacterium]